MSQHLIAEHRQHVESALRAGLPVPANVLADYPELKGLALSLTESGHGVPDRPQSDSPMVDAVVGDGLAAGIAISDEVRRRVLRAVLSLKKKRTPPSS